MVLGALLCVRTTEQIQVRKPNELSLRNDKSNSDADPVGRPQFAKSAELVITQSLQPQSNGIITSRRPDIFKFIYTGTKRVTAASWTQRAGHTVEAGSYVMMCSGAGRGAIMKSDEINYGRDSKRAWTQKRISRDEI